ncbi:hypothetical protein [Geothrix sp.]|jgi:hypothetical protein|uniref:hypothetical protein n=1 Tax=Geothrix sp. TaxID=1962974 RepID=UPI0025C0F5D0|nr:hypothetical protein [Geothrix sp.]
MADESTTPALELPKAQRHLTDDEAVIFLGLKSKGALQRLHKLKIGPPCVMLSARRRSYCLADLQAWAEARKNAN